MNIVLIGFMGTGKSTVGRLLASQLAYEFLDTDLLIEREQGAKIPQIFATHGEQYFRKIEQRLAVELGKTDHKVIATGGGMVLNPQNIVNLRQNGFVIALVATPEVIYERVKQENHRPLLSGANSCAKIAALLLERAPYYENSDLMINTLTKTAPELVADIIGYLGRRGHYGRSST